MTSHSTKTKSIYLFNRNLLCNNHTCLPGHAAVIKGTEKIWQCFPFLLPILITTYLELEISLQLRVHSVENM